MSISFTEKDSGFLRIGSLNVRVKRTTEAFSNFLGVGQQNAEKIHKSWGSADNVQQVRICKMTKNDQIYFVYVLMTNSRMFFCFRYKVTEE